MNSPLAVPTIMAQIFCDRIVWFISRDGELLAQGRCATYEELRGVQVRAGVMEVILYRASKGFELPKTLTHRGEWRVANSIERENLENFFTLATRIFSGRETLKTPAAAI